MRIPLPPFPVLIVIGILAVIWFLAEEASRQ